MLGRLTPSLDAGRLPWHDAPMNDFTRAWSALGQLRDALEALPQTPAIEAALAHALEVADELQRAEEASQVSRRVGRAT